MEADIRNTTTVTHQSTFNIVGVMHFAAFAYVGES